MSSNGRRTTHNHALYRYCHTSVCVFVFGTTPVPSRRLKRIDPRNMDLLAGYSDSDDEAAQPKHDTVHKESPVAFILPPPDFDGASDIRFVGLQSLRLSACS